MVSKLVPSFLLGEAMGGVFSQDLDELIGGLLEQYAAVGVEQKVQREPARG